MSDPIETTIQNRIDIVLNSIAEISMVKAYPFETISWELAVFPLCIFELEEQGWEDRNRLENYLHQLSLETWFKIPDGDPESWKSRGVYFGALIHKALFLDCSNKEVGLGKYISKISRQPPQYLKPDDTYGVVQLFYNVNFLIKYGDPFTQSNY